MTMPFPYRRPKLKSQHICALTIVTAAFHVMTAAAAAAVGEALLPFVFLYFVIIAYHIVFISTLSLLRRSS